MKKEKIDVFSICSETYANHIVIQKNTNLKWLNDMFQLNILSVTTILDPNNNLNLMHEFKRLLK